MTENTGMVEEPLYRKYLDALLAGRRHECTEIVQELLDSEIEVINLYQGLFQRSMYRVGELWENNIITVAKEHLATSITEGLLNLIYPSIFATERVGRKAVISCNVNEYHQVGGKMVADILELNGWDSMFLGANTPSEDMLKFIQEAKPDFVGLSLSIISNLNILKDTIELIRADFRQIDLMVGGQAFRWGGVDEIKRYANTAYIPTLDRLEQTLG